MGSIGDIFPYANPVVGSTDWPNWILCMDELITRVGNPVPFSALSGTDFDMDNNAIINIRDLQFQEQAGLPSANPGTVEFLNDEFWLITSAGAIQITNAGGINTTLLGGIAGDYGGVNPASVRFIDAANRYDFYDDFANVTWAYGRFRGLDIANGATGTKRARITFAGAADIPIILPPTLPADVNAVTIGPTGAVLPNLVGTPITGHIWLDTASLGRVKHGEYTVLETINPRVGGSATVTQTIYGAICNVAGTVVHQINGLQVGWRLKAVKFTTTKVAADVTDLEVLLSAFGAAAVSFATGTNNTIGAQTVTATLGVPQVLVAGTQVHIVVTNHSVGDKFCQVQTVYDEI